VSIAPDSPRETRSRILVVDDDRLATQVVRDLLEQEGYVVTAAGTGGEGLRQLRQSGADLLLLDVVLPDTDGFQILREVRGEPRLRQLPVIMCSVRSAVKERVRGLELGADDYIIKPFNPEELLARVRVMLRIRQMAEELRHRNEELSALYLKEQAISARLREADQFKDDLLTIISHELRTPLTSIKGSLSLLLDEQKVEGVTREFLEIAEQNTDRLIALVNDLLDLSRIESGKLELERERFSIRDAILSATQRIRALADRKGLRLEMQVPEGVPPVDADPGKVEQVLVNLLDNAIKFTPEGGQITLRAEAARGDGAATLQVSVSDTGIGIPSECLPRVFEKFYRVDMSSTRGARGTGLGLAICKAIVEGHGGRIWGESAPGGGSRFTFTLPLGPGEAGR
jgi:signal transduction histidine kinase